MFGQGQSRNDPFAEIDNVTTQGQRNPYLLAGLYLLQIQRTILFESREHKLFFLAELLIVESDNPERPPGMLCSWMTDMRKDMGPINVKRLLAAALDYDVESDEANEQITSDVARFAVSDAQPLRQREIYAQASDTTTRDNKPFLAVKWIPRNPPTPDQPK